MTTMTKVSSGGRRNAWRSRRWLNLLMVMAALASVWGLLNLVIGGACGGKCVVDTLSQTLRVATPIALAALCGVVCERSGVVDIGIEGKMLMAAMVGYAVNVYAFQVFKDMMDPVTAGHISRLVAVLAAVLSVLPLAALHAVASIRFKLDQIISGTIVNIMAIGITGYCYRQFLAENVPAGPGTFPKLVIPVLSDIPVIGPIFFRQQPLAYAMLILAIILHFMLFYTRWGLRTRSVGEHPRAADTLGVNVLRTRYINIMIGGAIAGLGGAWFTLESADVFNTLMTNGAGFIGLAAMIFGKWTPFGALGGALIFGLGSSLTTTIGIFRPDIPSQIPNMLPYLLTIIVLTGVVGRAIPPAADGQAYEKQ